MPDRILPKSLHTISVLVNLAGHIRASRVVSTSDAEDVAYALRILGLADLPDAHGLALKAVHQIGEARRKVREANDKVMADYRRAHSDDLIAEYRRTCHRCGARSTDGPWQDGLCGNCADAGYTEALVAAADPFRGL